MKALPLPNVDDEAILEVVVGRRPVSDCPHIDADAQSVRDRYEAYEQAQGNPHAQGCPQPIKMPGRLQKALAGRYDSSAAYLQPIDNLRVNPNLNICPMCGLPGIGTLDHIFPQVVYPELAIFSRNLVPACYRCNINRQHQYRGDNIGERIFHPYFDNALNQRLVRATLQQNPTFETPIVELESCLDATNALYATVNFHIETVLRRAGIIRFLESLWVDLQRFPRHELRTLPQGNFTRQEFDQAVVGARDFADEWHTTPNNWKSMIFEALIRNRPASDYLVQFARQIDADPGRAQDV